MRNGSRLLVNAHCGWTVHAAGLTKTWLDYNFVIDARMRGREERSSMKPQPSRGSEDLLTPTCSATAPQSQVSLRRGHSVMRFRNSAQWRRGHIDTRYARGPG